MTNGKIRVASLFVIAALVARLFGFFIRFLLLASSFLLLTETRDRRFLGVEAFDQVEQLRDLQRAVYAVGDADEFESATGFLNPLEGADDFADAHAVDDRHFGQVEQNLARARLQNFVDEHLQLEAALPFDELPAHVKRGDSSEIMNSDSDHIGVSDSRLRIADRGSPVGSDSWSAIIRVATGILPDTMLRSQRYANPNFDRTNSRRGRGRLSRAEADAADRIPDARARNRRAGLPQTRESSDHRRVQNSRRAEFHEPLRSGTLARRRDHGHAGQPRAIGGFGRKRLFDSRHDRRAIRQ